jgi:hypothetical protein
MIVIDVWLVICWFRTEGSMRRQVANPVAVDGRDAWLSNISDCYSLYLAVPIVLESARRVHARCSDLHLNDECVFPFALRFE